jgi:hypothetical protein
MPDDGVVFIYHQSVPDRWPLFNCMDTAKVLSLARIAPLWTWPSSTASRRLAIPLCLAEVGGTVGLKIGLAAHRQGSAYS